MHVSSAFCVVSGASRIDRGGEVLGSLGGRLRRDYDHSDPPWLVPLIGRSTDFIPRLPTQRFFQTCESRVSQLDVAVSK